ncbi:MAG: T9SS type A sorting domain-containing protein [Bacteroidia bacterium]
MVKDIYTGTTSSNTYLNGIIFNGNYIFAAEDGTNGIELWTTDGTTGNTSLVKDINAGIDNSDPRYFLIFNNIVYFLAYTTANGNELWRTDGTTSGTYMVKDIFPGFNSAFVDYNGNFPITLLKVWEQGGSFFFVANTDNSVAFSNDIELWKTDGTNAGTVKVNDINPGTQGSHPRDFLVFNNTLFFLAYTPATGSELWKTDGTTAGTVMLKDIFPGTNSAFVDYNGNTAITLLNVWEQGGSFFFVANTDNSVAFSNDLELWKTDGTTAGTVRVKDINAGTQGSHPSQFLVFNNTLFFRAYTTTNGSELWKTDGSTAGTVMVKDIFPGTNSGFVDYNGNFSINLVNVWEQGGSFFFVANTDNSVVSSNDIELWKTDGTTAGTVRVKDINPGVEGSNPRDFVVFNNQLFFLAYTVANGKEIWKTDGSSAGTVMVKDVYPGTNSGFVDYNGFYSIDLFNVWEQGGSFFFIANSDNSVASSNDIELWKTDGTTAGTVRVKDINAGTEGSHPYGFIPFNNQLYFAAYDNANGRELWKTDGSTAGTQQVKDIMTGTGSGLQSDFYKIFSYGGTFYFTAYQSGTIDNELWKSDGTNAGTVKVMDIYAGTNGSYPNSFIILPNDNVIFLARDATHGRELWSFNLPGISSVEEQATFDFSVFPNPAFSNEKITMRLSEQVKENSAVHLFDLDGKKIFSKKIPIADKEIVLQLPDVMPGIYLLQITDKKSFQKTCRILVLKKE